MLNLKNIVVLLYLLMKKAVCKVNEQKVSKQKASATRFVILDSLLGLPRAPLVGSLQGNRTLQESQKKI